jgi:hypothetical protein
MYRTGEQTDAPYMTAPEYQVLDDDKHPDGKDARTSAASLYGLYAGKDRSLHAVGNSNSEPHRGRGKPRRALVERRGRWSGRELASADWKHEGRREQVRRVAALRDAREGRIDLQDHGDEVWYRSIRIRELQK